MGPRKFRIAALDTETRGLDGELLFATLCLEGEKPIGFKSAYLLIDHILSLDWNVLSKHIFYAHHAEYDWRYIIAALEAWKDLFSIDLRERAMGKYYELRLKSKGEKTKSDKPREIIFRDSMALFPFSLKKFTAQFAPEFEKQDIGLGSGVIFNPRDPVHVDYALNDAEGLVAALSRFDELLFSKYRVHIRGTTASTAYAAMLRFLPEGDFFDRQKGIVEQFFRKSYYGGLVQINAPFNSAVAHVRTYDINSSYPAVMRLGVPKGAARFTLDYKRGFPGFYKVVAHVPSAAILPIVPFRNERGQVAWPRGEFETYLSSIEIDYCETLGVRFEIKSGYYFPAGLCFPFNSFVDACEMMRNEFKGQPLEIVVKLMQNSVYGRFGMRVEGRECVVDWQGQPDGFKPAFSEDDGSLISHVFYREVEREAEYMLPHWAAWITAGARIRLDRFTEKVGRHLVLYRDTDSLTVIGALQPPLLETGPRYGDLKDEGVKHDWIAHAPKVYSWRDESGALAMKNKGIPYRLQDSVFIGAVREGDLPERSYPSSTGLNLFLKSGKRQIERKRRPTAPENIYGHVIVDGWFRPREFLNYDETSEDQN